MPHIFGLTSRSAIMLTRGRMASQCERRDLCTLAISRQRFYSFLFKKVFIFLCHLNLPNDQHYCTAKCLLVPPCRCPVSSVARTGNDRAKSPLQTDHQPTKKQYKFYVLCLVWRCCNFSNFSSLMQSSGRRALELYFSLAAPAFTG